MIEDAIKAIKKDNRDAFNVIYNRYYGIVFTIAFELLKQCDRLDAGTGAEDTIQEVFTSIWIRRMKLPIMTEKEMTNYVARMSKNITINQMRNSKIRINADVKFYEEDYGDGVVALDGNSETEDISQRPLLVQIMKKVMNDKAIPKDAREAIGLFYGEGLRAVDIAQYNRQHLQTTKNKIHRTLKIMKQRAAHQLGQSKHGGMHVSKHD